MQQIKVKKIETEDVVEEITIFLHQQEKVEELLPEDKHKGRNSKKKINIPGDNKNRSYRNHQNKENKNKHAKDKLFIRQGAANRLKSSQPKNKTTPANVACETKLLLILITDIVIQETKTKESVAETFHL